MDGIYEIIKQAGRIPLNELVLRSSENPTQVTEAVKKLVDSGLVKVHGQPLPQGPQQSVESVDTMIEVSKLAV
jgi:hypothetical protein